MANSTAPVHFKPTVAFNRGDTFVFGAWVCTADGAGSFQRRLTMQPNPKTGLVTLPEAVTGELAGKEPAPEYSSDSDAAPDRTPDSSPLSEFYLNPDYEFDFGSDPEDPESENDSTELPLSGPASGLVIKSTPAGRYVYWPDHKPADLAKGDSRYVAYIDSLPF
jgi:hypothetical protein